MLDFQTPPGFSVQCIAQLSQTLNFRDNLITAPKLGHLFRLEWIVNFVVVNHKTTSY